MAMRDMALGGTFGTGYTPIQFAPLVSLTGPVAAPTTPVAPEAPAAPMMPRMLPQDGMAQMPDNAYMTGEMMQGTPGAGFVNPLAGMSGSQIGQKAMDMLSFFTSPIGFAAQYAMTGKTPSENLSGLLSGQGGAPGGNPFAGFLQGLRGMFPGYGPEEVPLFETRAPVQTAVPSMVFDGGLYSVTPELAPIEQTNAIFNDPAFYNAVVAGLPVDQVMQQPNMAQIFAPLMQALLEPSPFSQFGPQETGGGFAPSDFGGAGANAPEGSSSFGDAISGAYGYV